MSTVKKKVKTKFGVVVLDKCAYPIFVVDHYNPRNMFLTPYEIHRMNKHNKQCSDYVKACLKVNPNHDFDYIMADYFEKYLMPTGEHYEDESIYASEWPGDAYFDPSISRYSM